MTKFVTPHSKFSTKFYEINMAMLPKPFILGMDRRLILKLKNSKELKEALDKENNIKWNPDTFENLFVSLTEEFQNQNNREMN